MGRIPLGGHENRLHLFETGLYLFETEMGVYPLCLNLNPFCHCELKSLTQMSVYVKQGKDRKEIQLSIG